jgi:hypothetical protein
VVELKRDKTPRTVTAQAFDYGSWVVGLSNERIRSLREEYLPKSLRKNRQKCGVFPSRELITRCSGWISLIQRLRTLDFRSFAPLGLPDRCRLARPLGNQLLMPSPLSV